MKAGWTKGLIAIAATAAIALTGCGGGSDSTGASTTQSTTTGAQKPKQAAGEPSSSRTTPSSNQGASAAAPGVPTSKGGDNSIQTFGLEASSSERAQATSTAQAYLNARASKQWGAACSYLTHQMQDQLQALLSKAKSAKAKGCSAAMEAMSASVPPSALRKAAAIHVLSLRVKGAQAFLIYRDGQGTPSALPMAHEGGTWKVGALAGSPLLL